MRAEEAEAGDQSYSHGHLANISRLWPSGVVEYKWYYTFPRPLRIKLMEAMDYITEKVPCITFNLANSQPVPSPNYVIIHPGTKCRSQKGMRGGAQTITLNLGCFNNNLTLPVHELMHTLGFVHEHNRTLVLASKYCKNGEGCPVSLSDCSVAFHKISLSELF